MYEVLRCIYLLVNYNILLKADLLVKVILPLSIGYWTKNQFPRSELQSEQFEHFNFESCPEQTWWAKREREMDHNFIIIMNLLIIWQNDFK